MSGQGPFTGRPASGETRLPLLSTGDHECPYLPGRTARTAFVDPRVPLSATAYRRLLDEGFRRSGSYVYRPQCQACNACQTLRIPAREFRFRRRHRRCLQANAGVSITATPARLHPLQYELYARYVSQRHAGGSLDDPSAEAYRAFLMAEWCPTAFLELREDGRLLGVAVTDLLGDALSAVYTFYDPALLHRGLGMLAILRQIELARAQHRDWLYLGYWIEGCERMSYKADYRPHEIRGPAGWRRIDPD